MKEQESMTDQTAKTANLPEVSGKLLFYKDPVLLRADLHGHMGVSAVPDPFAFAASTHMIPLTMNEFPAAACCYPIVFAGEQMLPVAAMGMRQNHNVMIDESGNWVRDLYIPAYVRRYPFVLAGAPGSDTMTLCFDRACPYVSAENPQFKFFEDGALSAYSQNALELCQTFEREQRATAAAMEKLRQLDLFTMRRISFEPPGSTGQVGALSAAFYGIDEGRFDALDDESFSSLRRDGLLNLIYGHLYSLANWTRIANITAREAAGPS